MKKSITLFLCFILVDTECSPCTIHLSDKTYIPDVLSSSNHMAFIHSNLPIVIITTDRRRIKNSKRTAAKMEIIFNGNGNINLLTDSSNYHGEISIKIRGSSSKRFPKKSYSFQILESADIKQNVSLLGLPAANDWVLYAPYNDKSLMRDVITYKSARDMGRYASRTVYAELILNGDYKGVYVLEEPVSCNPYRVNIPKMSPEDSSGDELTGGYILKIDRPDRGESFWSLKKFIRIGFTICKSELTGKKRNEGDTIIKEKKPERSLRHYVTSTYLPPRSEWQTITFVYHSPNSKDITPAQAEYIRDFIFKAESSLGSPGFDDPDSGYRRYWEASSFIDFFILNEVARNVDAYRLSAYFYKERGSRGGRLAMGPVWDFNNSMGNANYCGGKDTSGWAYNFNSYCSNDAWLVPFWWKRLMEDSLFTTELKCRWNSLRQSALRTDYLMNTIDSIAFLLEDAQQRNFQRWNILGKYIWANSRVCYSYNEEVRFLKQWLTGRLEWLDRNMPGNCIEPK